MDIKTEIKHCYKEKSHSCRLSYILILAFLMVIKPLMSQELDDKEADYRLENKYQHIHIIVPPHKTNELLTLGLALDCGVVKTDTGVEGVFSTWECKMLKEHGFEYLIIIDDMEKYYRDQMIKDSINQLEYIQPVGHEKEKFFNLGGCQEINWNDPIHFTQGSMAGYLTYEEMLTQLNLMHSLYPDIISAPIPISNQLTNEGRVQYYQKISDNVGQDEEEPEMLYTALHHAREPMSLMQLIYYMWYLLENYGSDELATGIVNQMELFFIPCVNPDGYIHNQTTNPWGGGMWRKNKRVNSDGSLGVDLNRNYGFNWGVDDMGSSPNPNATTYRGTAPFSEPETDNIRDFVESRNFISCYNYHTYGNLWIYPWGYNSTPTIDDNLFRLYSERQTWYNRFRIGNNDITVGYLTNGEADDWFYGEQNTKPKIYAMTPEVGSNQWGFWPGEQYILPYCRSTLQSNLETAKLNGAMIEIIDNQNFSIPNSNGNIILDIKRLGLSDGDYTIDIVPITDNIVFTSPVVTMSNMNIVEQQSLAFDYTISNAQAGDYVQYRVNVSNGFFPESKDFTKMYMADIVYAEGFNELSNWNNIGFYTTDVDFYAGGMCVSESPTQPYNGNVEKSITMSNTISLVGLSEAVLEIYGKWDMYNNKDYWQISVSNDDGVSWTPLCGKYTKDADAQQGIVAGLPIYCGYQPEWIREEYSLYPWIGQNIKLKIYFNAISGNARNYAGMYIDEMKIYGRPQGLSLGVKTMLEGPYNESVGLMNTDLMANNLIPQNQPYNISPYNYYGTEQVNVFAPNIVDWVLVELREPSDLSIIKARRAALLRNDGMIVDIDGSTTIDFVNIVAGSYYITLYHYTHLAVISAQPVILPNSQIYDFTSSASAALGIQQLKPIGGSIYALHAGDYDHSGVINNLDYNRWASMSAQVNTYLEWDGNASGVVNATDYNLWYANRSKVGNTYIQF